MRASAKDIFLITVATIFMAILLLYLVFAFGTTSAAQTETTLDYAFQTLPFLLLLPRTWQA